VWILRFIPELLKIIHVLPDLFSNAVWAIQETSFNQYDIFAQFLNFTEKNKLITVMWAMGSAPDKNDERFVEHILPFFESEDMDLVRQAILSLMEIQNERIPPLVDKAFERFPNFETLRKNYYRRTWDKII